MVGKQIMNSRRLPSKMGSRNQEIRPVAAWVEPEDIQHHNQINAVHSAELEEQRLRGQHHQKAERLRRFQEDVRRRVQALDRAKRDEALRKSYQAVEVERKVICQSAVAAERLTPRKDRCNVRQDRHLHIRHTATVNTHGGIISDHEQDQEKDAQFEEHTNKVKTFSRQARRKLTSRKLATEHSLHQDLPGGVWANQSREPSCGQDPENEEVSDVDSDKENADEHNMRVVHFEESQPEQGLGPTRQPQTNVPDIYPGVHSEAERTRAQSQRAMYRRLFMDIEREQVRENQRRKHHQRKINDIKSRAEAERRLVEETSRLALAPTDPVTGETEQESIERERIADRTAAREDEARQRARQRDRDSVRFLEALKRNLREKVEKRGVELPPLCCCGATVWDTNPDTCANNCVFYRDNKAYGRALQSLLASCDVI